MAHVHGEPPVVRVEIDPEGRFPDVDRSNQIWRRGGGGGWRKTGSVGLARV